MLEDKSLADEVICGVVQILGQEGSTVDWLEARVIFSYDVLLDKLHSATSSYCSTTLIMDELVSSTMTNTNVEFHVIDISANVLISQHLFTNQMIVFDTSMAMCLAESLVTMNGFDALDQMQRYLRWRDDGYYSSTGRCFGIGKPTNDAIVRFTTTGKPMSGSTHPSSAGNSSLMRLAPVPMFYEPSKAKARSYAAQSSHTTHAARECVDACALFAEMLVSALAGQDKDTLLFGNSVSGLASEIIIDIAKGEYKNKSAKHIRGNGYVVDSMEATLWCFWTTDTFSEAVLAAANLGDDADTTGAICRQVAGAYYGHSSIRVPWLDKLYMRDEIIKLAEKLAGH